MSDKEDTNAVEFLVKMLDLNGIATAQVKDGRLFLFKRAKMQQLLDAHKDSETLSIMIRTQDFKN